MIDRKTWMEFKKAGMLWWINTQLHMFGWALVFEYDEQRFLTIYPARVKFRGFSEEITEEGYKKVTNFLADNIVELQKEVNEE